MEQVRRWAALVVLVMLVAMPLASTPGRAAEPTLPDLVEWVNLSPMPSSRDLMNDEIPHVTVLGDDLAFLWETDYTHWPNPDGTQPIELPENEDVQLRFMTDGELGPIMNVSSLDTIPEGYGHRPAMTVFQGKLYVWWNSHAWSGGDIFQVVLRVYDPADGTWDDPRPITDMEEGGIAAGASAAVLGDRLWFVWQARYPFEGNGTDPGIDIYGRWTDGEDWGPVEHISGGEAGADTEPSAVAVGDELHVAWSHDSAERPGNADLHHAAMDPSGEWGPVTDGMGAGENRDDKKVELLDWNGTLVMLWQADGINLQGRVYSDAMMMLMEEGEWGPPLLVSPPGKDSGNVVPTGEVYRDRLFIAWATGDDGITIGSDLDVVFRDFDGQRFGDIVSLSPSDTNVDGNPSDDGSVDLVVYHGNLYAVFDAIFSPVTDGPNKDVLLRYIGYDIDGDGVDDAEDAFPLDPGEQVDTDGVGVGDNADAYPKDPDRWKVEAEQEPPPYGDICMVTGMAFAVLVPLLLLLGMHISQKRKTRGKG